MQAAGDYEHQSQFPTPEVKPPIGPPDTGAVQPAGCEPGSVPRTGRGAWTTTNGNLTSRGRPQPIWPKRRRLRRRSRAWAWRYGRRRANLEEERTGPGENRCRSRRHRPTRRGLRSRIHRHRETAPALARDRSRRRHRRDRRRLDYHPDHLRSHKPQTREHRGTSTLDSHRDRRTAAIGRTPARRRGRRTDLPRMAELRHAIHSSSGRPGSHPARYDNHRPCGADQPSVEGGVLRASDLYAQAADSFESQIAAGTRPCSPRSRTPPLARCAPSPRHTRPSTLLAGTPCRSSKPIRRLSIGCANESQHLWCRDSAASATTADAGLLATAAGSARREWSATLACACRRWHHRRGHRQHRSCSHHSERARQHRTRPNVAYTRNGHRRTARTPAPAALPTSQADRQTCETRAAASRLISEASVAQGVIPEGMTIVDPAVRSNPAWSAGVQKAGSLYTQAGDVLKVTPGATQVLAEAVSTASKALRALGTAYTNFDAANGNVYDIASQSSDAMDVVCGRLAP